MCKASDCGPCGISKCLRKVVITPKGADDDVAGPSTHTDKVIRLLLPHVQFLLTLSQGTEPGISTLAAGGMAADPACLSLWHEPGPRKSPYSVAMPGYLARRISRTQVVDRPRRSFPQGFGRVPDLGKATCKGFVRCPQAQGQRWWERHGYGHAWGVGKIRYMSCCMRYTPSAWVRKRRRRSTSTYLNLPSSSAKCHPYQALASIPQLLAPMTHQGGPMPLGPFRAFPAVTPGNACVSSVCLLARLPQDPMLLESQAHVQGIRARTLWDLRCLRKVVITPKGADDDVAGPSTGTDKGDPTVTPTCAIPADSESGDRARHLHPCGWWHGCWPCMLVLMTWARATEVPLLCDNTWISRTQVVDRPRRSFPQGFGRVPDLGKATCKGFVRWPQAQGQRWWERHGYGHAWGVGKIRYMSCCMRYTPSAWVRKRRRRSTYLNLPSSSAKCHPYQALASISCWRLCLTKEGRCPYDPSGPFRHL